MGISGIELDLVDGSPEGEETESVAGRNVKVLVIGLDGATLDIIRPLAEAGRLPTFRRFMEEGAWGVLQSTVPPVTPPAWASFMTGKNPGKHGVFDMIRVGADREVLWPNATWVQGKTLWDLIGERGMRVGVIDVPMTFPPTPVNGYMVAGMFTPSQESEFTYPPTLQIDLLKEFGSYPMERELVGSFAGGDVLGGLRSVCDHTEKRKQAALYLLRKYDVEFLAVVFRGPDVVQHYGFRYVDEAYRRERPHQAARYHKMIDQYYEVLDGVVAGLLDAVGDGTTAVIMSDHGAGPVRRCFHVNKWLHDEGFLALKPWPSVATLRLRVRWAAIRAALDKLGLAAVGRALPARLGDLRLPFPRLRRDRTQIVNWSRTRAFANIVSSPIKITINTSSLGKRGKQVGREEREMLRREIIEGLRSLRDPATGEPVISQVWVPEDVYSGPLAHKAPDITFLTTEHKFRCQVLPYAPALITEPDEERLGMHRMEGVLMMRGPAVRSGCELAEAQIVDLAPTVLHLLELEIPSDMDGAVLTGALREEYVARHPERWSLTREEPIGETDTPREVFSQDERRRIERDLGELGYLG